MRRSVIITIVAVAVAFVAVRGVIAWQDTRNQSPVVKTAKTATTRSTALPSRTADAGAVTVKVEPREVSSGGAEFRVTFDTHSVPLDVDVARSSHLLVGGTTWSGATWSGDGPGGHHRSGQLRFQAAGPPTGEASLHIAGLPKPVSMTWTLPGS